MPFAVCACSFYWTQFLGLHARSFLRGVDPSSEHHLRGFFNFVKVADGTPSSSFLFNIDRHGFLCWANISNLSPSPAMFSCLFLLMFSVHHKLRRTEKTLQCSYTVSQVPGCGSLLQLKVSARVSTTTFVLRP